MDKKIEEYVKEANRRADKPYWLAPLLFRILWHCGLKIRPPVFQTFRNNFISYAILGLVLSYCILSLFLRLSLPPVGKLPESIFFGIFFGWYIARGYAKELRSIGSPSWEDYDPQTHKSLLPRNIG
jgi:hypothetical protein